MPINDPIHRVPELNQTAICLRFVNSHEQENVVLLALLPNEYTIQCNVQSSKINISLLKYENDWLLSSAWLNFKMSHECFYFHIPFLFEHTDVCDCCINYNSISLIDTSLVWSIIYLF